MGINKGKTYLIKRHAQVLNGILKIPDSAMNLFSLEDATDCEGGTQTHLAVQ